MRTPLSRKDIEARLPVATRETEEQSYTEQILKYIPAEVVAFYIPALAAAANLKPPANGATTISAHDIVVWVVFLLGLVGTVIYIHKQAIEELTRAQIDHVKQRARLKAVMSCFAFGFWALYLGGPFVGIEGYETYGTLAILGYTFLTPAIYDFVPIPFRFPWRKCATMSTKSQSTRAVRE